MYRFKRHILLQYFIIAGILLSISCNKKDKLGPYKLSYGSSVIYLKNQSGDYKVSPTEIRPGEYTVFPKDGLKLDKNTGVITVTGSDTGLKYRITHTAPNGDTTSTVILLSGITYFDKFYNISQGDTVAMPVYNANASNPLPLVGSSFDENNNANSYGCSVKTANGQINLAETVRNGVFGAIPQNDVPKEFDIEYRLNDPSEKALNKLTVRLYWYDSMADVAPDVLEILNERQNQGVFLQANQSTFPQAGTARSATALEVARPRPPCIILIGQ